MFVNPQSIILCNTEYAYECKHTLVLLRAYYSPEYEYSSSMHTTS